MKNNVFNMRNIIYISATHTILCFDTKLHANIHVFSLKTCFKRSFSVWRKRQNLASSPKENLELAQ